MCVCLCVFVPAMFASVLILKPAALPTAARGGSKAEGQQEAVEEEEEAIREGVQKGKGGHTQRNAHTVTAPSGSLELRRMR